MAAMGRLRAAKQLARGDFIRLSGVDWMMYRRLLKAFDEYPGIKLTYDRGELEIMSPFPIHEGDSRFLHALVILLVEELNPPLRHGGGSTLRRRARQRGLEPDDSYWIA